MRLDDGRAEEHYTEVALCQPGFLQQASENDRLNRLRHDSDSRVRNSNTALVDALPSRFRHQPRRTSTSPGSDAHEDGIGD